MNMNPKKIIKVYIIESPSPIDILNQRFEGKSLSELLKLAEIKNEYYNVVNISCLKECLSRIASDLSGIRKDIGGIILHLSMHGNKDGIALTSNEFINWESFYKIITEFNELIEYVELPNGRKIAPISLFMSVCEGFMVSRIKSMNEEYCPYTSVVGPTKSVDWSDSLIAFSTLYHNTIHKPIKLKYAVDKMNYVCGLENVFCYDVAQEFLTAKE